jgi:hypothetical protein
MRLSALRGFGPIARLEAASRTYNEHNPVAAPMQCLCRGCEEYRPFMGIIPAAMLHHRELERRFGAAIRLIQQRMGDAEAIRIKFGHDIT